MYNVTAKQLADAKLDFRKFVWIVWKHLNLPAPTPVQYEIAEYLQHGPRRQVIEAFRGVGKSWITSAFVLWLLLNDPQLKVLVVSASKDRSDAFSTFTKRLINEMPILQHLRADVKKDQRDSNVAFDVGPARPAHAPSCKSVGVYGQMTGSRANVIIFDDAEVPNNSETATQREKLLIRVTEGGGAVLAPGGRVIYLGTPQTEDSLYNKLPEKGYDIRMWPARVPEKPEIYAGRLAPSIMEMGKADTPVDPRRFTEFELAEREAEYGRAGFRLQFMLDTSLTDELRFPLKLHDLIVMPTDVDTFPDKVVWAGDPDHTIEYLPRVGFHGDRFQKPMFTSEGWGSYTKSLLYIDPSGRGRDEVGYAVVKFRHGMLVIREWGGLTGGYDEPTLVKLALIAWRENVNLIIAEDNFGNGMWTQMLKPVVRKVWAEQRQMKLRDAIDGVEESKARALADSCKVEDDTVGSQMKELRVIESLEAAMGSHRVIIDEALVKRMCAPKVDSSDQEAALKNGLYQMTRIARERGCLKYDDQIDALAGAIRYYTENMAQDVDEQAKAAKTELLEEELEKFMESAGSHLPHSKTWGGSARR